MCAAVDRGLYRAIWAVSVHEIWRHAAAKQRRRNKKLSGTPTDINEWRVKEENRQTCVRSEVNSQSTDTTTGIVEVHNTYFARE
jgi:hypothetical protein